MTTCFSFLLSENVNGFQPADTSNVHLGDRRVSKPALNVAVAQYKAFVFIAVRWACIAGVYKEHANNNTKTFKNLAIIKTFKHYFRTNVNYFI